MAWRAAAVQLNLVAVGGIKLITQVVDFIFDLRNPTPTAFSLIKSLWRKEAEAPRKNEIFFGCCTVDTSGIENVYVHGLSRVSVNVVSR